MEIAPTRRDVRATRGIVITRRMPRIEDRSKKKKMARRGGEEENGQSPDGDAQFNLNAYYLFSHITLGQSRGQFLFSEGVLKADVL